jgi:hypothetical protein
MLRRGILKSTVLPHIVVNPIVNIITERGIVFRIQKRASSDGAISVSGTGDCK